MATDLYTFVSESCLKLSLHLFAVLNAVQLVGLETHLRSYAFMTVFFFNEAKLILKDSTFT